MRQSQYLMSCALILIVSWTASSQITGIPRERKIEIVSTLEAYPVVLRELDIYYDLLDKCENVQQLYRKQINQADMQILKLEQINTNNQKQIDILNTQIKKKPKQKWFVPLLIGVVGGVVLGTAL